MKLKYKKIILLTTMSTMGIGILTLSVSHDETEAKVNTSAHTRTEAAVVDDTAVVNFSTDADVTPALSSEPTVSPVPTNSPTPAPMPVYAIEQEGTYPAIDKLIQDYYTAKNNRDVDALKVLFTDLSGVDSQEDLQAKTEYIDEYRNIKTYIKKGYIEGTYIVYVYSEIKFTSINTPAPGLAQFYVVTGEDNKPKIFSGNMEDKTAAYYSERNSDEDVVALIEMTDKKSDEAIKSDEDLHNFTDNIKEIMAGSSDEAQAEGDTN